ncbi:MAG: stalk domain-containing protein [Thermacetogeniaceae bacterium]
MKNVKMFVCGFLVCAMLIGIAAVAFADSGVNVTAVLSSTIKMKLNGNDFNPQDTDGTYVKPLIYNGRTYLPVKFLAAALNIPVDWDGRTSTVWIGGQSDLLQVNDVKYYEDYYGTVLTTDTGMLTSPSATYKWGVTNDKPLDMQYFTFFLKPNGLYKRFRASFFLDSSAKDNLTINIRKDNYDGQVIKSIVLQPGATLDNVDLDIGGIDKICIESNIAINHGIIKKLIVGEPIFYNETLPSVSATHR